MSRIRYLFIALFITACSATTTSTIPQSSPAKSADDRNLTTPMGATLTVPEGFQAAQTASMIKLVDPDKQATVYLVEVQSADTQDAIAEAWALADPTFTAKEDKNLSPPASHGYDEYRVINYVLSPEGIFTQALARRKGEATWVSIIQGTPAAIEKRGAQMKTFLSGMKVPGLEEDSLKDKEPQSITKTQDELRRFVEQALQATGTPGLSIAVVEDGKIVYADGFGVLEIGKEEKVDADTLMMIGSVTKSMTTLMMATLVDDGKFSWDTKAAQMMPSFKVADPKLTDALTAELLVCACAGLPRKDLPLILEFGKKTPQDVFAELGNMKASTGLKETFQYQNHMVAAGGYAAAHVDDPDADIGDAYDRAMNDRVFKPLQMTRTTLDFDSALATNNRATPHSQDLQAKHQVVDIEHERFTTYVRPSGGVWSTAKEMANYVLTELGRGMGPNGTRIVSAENLMHRWQPQVAINATTAYGLGWVSGTTHGLPHIQHGGGTMGFATHLSFFPEKNLGVVMLSNGTGGHLVEAMVRKRLLELWFGIDAGAQATLDFALKAQAEEIAKVMKNAGTPDAAWITPLMGSHKNSELGEITVRKEGDGYVLDAGEYKTQVVQYQRPDGKKVLLFADAPLAGMELVPTEKDKGLFEIKRAQEEYVFE